MTHYDPTLRLWITAKTKQHIDSFLKRLADQPLENRGGARPYDKIRMMELAKNKM